MAYTHETVDIGIIGAMDIEIMGLTSLMADRRTHVISGISFHMGTVHGKKVVAAVCGVGKVFAAVCAQTMILRYSPRVIVNTGVAGTLTDKLSIGDTAVAASVVQHDMDTTAIGDPPGCISGINVVNIPTDKGVSDLLVGCVNALGKKAAVGVIATGDTFISDSTSKTLIVQRFGAVACEMEGGAVGQVCYINKVPFGVLRTISDGGDEQSHLDYPVFAEMAAHQSIEIMKLFIDKFS